MPRQNWKDRRQVALGWETRKLQQQQKSYFLTDRSINGLAGQQIIGPTNLTCFRIAQNIKLSKQTVFEVTTSFSFQPNASLAIKARRQHHKSTCERC